MTHFLLFEGATGLLGELETEDAEGVAVVVVVVEQSLVSNFNGGSSVPSLTLPAYPLIPILPLLPYPLHIQNYLW